MLRWVFERIHRSALHKVRLVIHQYHVDCGSLFHDIETMERGRVSETCRVEPLGALFRSMDIWLHKFTCLERRHFKSLVISQFILDSVLLSLVCQYKSLVRRLQWLGRSELKLDLRVELVRLETFSFLQCVLNSLLLVVVVLTPESGRDIALRVSGPEIEEISALFETWLWLFDR